MPVFKVVIKQQHNYEKIFGKSPESLYWLVPTAGYSFVKNNKRLHARPVHMMSKAFLFPS